jgi:RNA polymerase sigma factor FliA
MTSEKRTTRRKQTMTEETRDRIVLDNLSLVKAIAVRVHENLPVHVDLDDLVHAGVLGLFDAVSKYNPETNVIFQSYAKHRIKGAILDSLRQADWASRDLRKRQKQVEAMTREFTARQGRTPTEAEIAEHLGVSVERWRRMSLELKNVSVMSTSALQTDSDNAAPVEFPDLSDTQPDALCAREQMRSMLASAMKDLPQRYQKVVFLYYTNDMTMKEIGDVLGVNESRVSQIHKVALAKMGANLREAGIHSCQLF